MKNVILVVLFVFSVPAFAAKTAAKAEVKPVIDNVVDAKGMNKDGKCPPGSHWQSTGDASLGVGNCVDGVEEVSGTKRRRNQ